MVIEKICVICNKTFLATRKSQICCSKECSVKRFRQKQKEITSKKGKDYKKICAVCGKEFVTRRQWQTYCSKECVKKFKTEYVIKYNETHREKINEYCRRKYKQNKDLNEHLQTKETKIAICKVCGKEFIKKYTQTICSDECRRKRRKEYYEKWHLKKIEEDIRIDNENNKKC